MADETPTTGGLASAPTRTLGTRLSTWAERHAQVAVASIGRLGSRPIATLLVWAVIGVALTLPALLQVAVRNLAAAAPGQERAYVLNVFLKPSIGAAEARQVADRLGARDDIAAVELVTPDEALAEFRVRSGFGEALDALTENPLPATLLLTPSPANANPAGMATLRDQLQRLREVDQVSADTQWAERLQALLAAASRVADGMALLLAVAVLLVVGQVVRADIETRRAEIEVSKLLGATDGFVRRPFLYTGLLYGLGGGLVALLLVAGSVAWLAPAVTRVAALYGSRFELLGLPGQTAFLLVAGGAALGWAGSWVAATWRLRQIEPSV
jgi:cell division transport system permease protein